MFLDIRFRSAPGSLANSWRVATCGQKLTHLLASRKNPAEAGFFGSRNHPVRWLQHYMQEPMADLVE
jgi:hypothetical protein